MKLLLLLTVLIISCFPPQYEKAIVITTDNDTFTFEYIRSDSISAYCYMQDNCFVYIYRNRINDNLIKITIPLYQIHKITQTISKIK